MPRLIDADTVVTILLYDDMSEEWETRKMTIAETIDRWSDEGCPPTIDAVPVRHGKWIVTRRTNVYGGIELQCPFCNDRVMVSRIEDEIYCRHCGAKLGEEE